MSDLPKKRRGRPPKDPTAPTGARSFHLGLRLSDQARDKLLRLVELANERSRAAGIPPAVTPSSLVGLWIGQRIDEEWSKVARSKK